MFSRLVATRVLLAGAILAVCLGLSRAMPRARADDAPPRPLDAAEALRSYRVKPGLRIELVASEPLIEDPVAIDFGPDGRLWVCEMHDYPMGEDGKYTPGGRIKILKDTDGDGRYDQATLFLDGLSFPTGIMAWRKGALVCAAPQVIYAEDTDGDGKADRREVVMEGFGTGHPQAKVNSLYLGLDNWLYGASGLQGGRITMLSSGKAIEIGSRDFRFLPDTGAIEPVSGRTQHGRARDDFGNHFGNSNSSLFQHYPLPENFAAHNPSIAPPAPYVFVPRDEDNSRVFPASVTLTRFNDFQSANHVTSACGPGIYRDTLLGEGYAGNAFICEPVHNLVTRQVLTPEGVTFAGHRAEDETQSEFLASTDNWARPVQVRTGPDGALYVVDMYRYVIEHPRWISPGMLANLDVRAGADRGRIYRIVPEGVPPRPVPRLDQLDTKALAAALDSPNGTLRDMVHRLLLHRHAPEASPVLAKLAASAANPAVRLQALCVLDGLGALPEDLLLSALRDSHPEVRRQAARLAGTRLAKEPKLGPALLPLANDDVITVRFQTAMSLSEWNDPLAGKALGRIALKDPDDPWLRAAVLGASGSQPAAVLEAALVAAKERKIAPPAELVGPLVASAAEGAQDVALSALVATLTQPEPGGGLAPWRLSALADLLGSRRVSGDNALQKSLLKPLAPALAAARALAEAADAPEADRLAAISLLGRAPGHTPEDRDRLAGLIDPRQPASVANAAVRALDESAGEGAAGTLLERWEGLGPSVRASVLDALLARGSGMRALIEAVKNGKIAEADLGALGRKRLLEAGDEAIRKSAGEVFTHSRPETRAEVLATATEALKAHRGDLARGQAVFEKHCATCHAIAGKGQNVGPDLAELTDRSAEALLIAILDPNRDVDPRYIAYNAALHDGRVLNGLIASESGNALTLRGQEGKQEVILRSDLEDFRGTGQSLMPEGMEKDLPPGDLADLIAFVASGGPTPRVVPGNQPKVVQQAKDGSIRLEASTAEIYGDTLTFETEHGNLGYWQSENDRAVWSFVVDRPGIIYNVSMEWACPDDSAGNSFYVIVDGGPRYNLVASTGSWSHYDSTFISESRLAPGTHRLEIRPNGAVKGALLDLKAVTVTPIR